MRNSLSKLLVLIFVVAAVLGAKTDVFAATSTGVFYWWSSSSNGYYGNDGVWRSWDTNPPAMPGKRYDMNSNVIPMDGYRIQSVQWGGSVYKAADGHWKKKVNVTYYKEDPAPAPTPTPAPVEVIVLPSISLTQYPTTSTNKDVVVLVNVNASGRSIAVKKWAAGNQTINYFANNGTVFTGDTFTVGGNNTYTVYVKDSAGTQVSSTITISNIDKTPLAKPTFTAVPNSSGGVTLVIDYPEGSSSKVYKLNNGGPVNYTTPLNISSNTVVTAIAYDAVGNASQNTYTVSNLNDTSAPTGSVKINNDSSTTNSQLVVLTLSASDAGSGVSKMIASALPTFADAAWENYSAAKVFTLPVGDGVKTVFVKFKDVAGNESQIYSDSIILSGSMPIITLNPPTASIPSGTLTQAQWVVLTAESGSTIRYTTDGSEPSDYSAVYTVPIYVDRTMVIRAKAYKNGAASSTMTASYVLGQDDASSLLTRAKDLYKNGRYDEAITLLNRLLETNKDNQDAIMLLADCYIKKSDLSTAKSRLQQFIYVYEYPRVVNKYAEVCLARGEYKEDRGEYSDARAEYDESAQKILNILPKYQNETYLYRTLAHAYEKLNITGIRVFVYGSEVNFSRYDNVRPRLDDGGRTLIPVRALAESLGADVMWDSYQNKATITLDGKVVEITAGQVYAKVNGESVRLDAPARMINSRIMVPLRFISENFGKEVNWYAVESVVNIISITNPQ